MTDQTHETEAPRMTPLTPGQQSAIYRSTRAIPSIAAYALVLPIAVTIGVCVSALLAAVVAFGIVAMPIVVPVLVCVKVPGWVKEARLETTDPTTEVDE